jgi:hypothetical protein
MRTLTRASLLLALAAVLAFAQPVNTTSALTTIGTGSISSGTFTYSGVTCTPNGWCYPSTGAALASAKPIPRPRSLKLTPQQVAPMSYIELAKEAGALGAAESAEIDQSLESLNLPVFNIRDVSDYMTDDAARHGHSSWGWRPLRDGDSDLVDSASKKMAGRSIGLDSRPYARQIPTDVLETVRLVAGALPKAVFLVSDYEDPKPDPFLAVTTPRMIQDGRVWVIADWDEPGFMRKKVTINSITTK